MGCFLLCWFPFFTLQVMCNMTLINPSASRKEKARNGKMGPEFSS